MATPKKLPTGFSTTVVGGTTIVTGPLEENGFKGNMRINSQTGEITVFTTDNKQVYKIQNNEITEFDIKNYKSAVDSTVLNVRDSSGNSKPITDAQARENITKLTLQSNELAAQSIAYLRNTDTNYTPPQGIPGGIDGENITVSRFKGDGPAGISSSFFDPVATASNLKGFFIDYLGKGEFKLNADFTSTNMKDLFPANEVLQYPLDAVYVNKNKSSAGEIQDPGQDYLEIRQYEYKAPYGGIFTEKDETNKVGPARKIVESGVLRGTALKNPFSTLLLPIPNNVGDQNSVQWGISNDNFTPLTAGAANLAATNPLGMASGIAISDLLAGALEKVPTLGAFLKERENRRDVRRVLLNAAIGGLINPDTQAAVASMLLEKYGIEMSPETILSRGHGVVVNSNMELLFSGPIMRGFSFGYRMTARSEDEAKMIKRIIRYFKQGMAAKKANAKAGRGGPSYFLATPNVFKLSYKSGNEEISGMHKFKICALTNCSVNYTPDQAWNAYEKGQPTSYIMALTFNELEPIYESDYQEQLYRTTQDLSNGGKVNESQISVSDIPSVSNNDIGF